MGSTQDDEEASTSASTSGSESTRTSPSLSPNAFHLLPPNSNAKAAGPNRSQDRGGQNSTVSKPQAGSSGVGATRKRARTDSEPRRNFRIRRPIPKTRSEEDDSENDPDTDAETQRERGPRDDTYAPSNDDPSDEE